MALRCSPFMLRTARPGDGEHINLEQFQAALKGRLSAEQARLRVAGRAVPPTGLPPPNPSPSHPLPRFLTLTVLRRRTCSALSTRQRASRSALPSSLLQSTACCTATCARSCGTFSASSTETAEAASHEMSWLLWCPMRSRLRGSPPAKLKLLRLLRQFSLNTTGSRTGL